MEEITKKIEALCTFRDNFFFEKPKATKDEHKKTVRERALQLLEEIPLDIQSKATRSLLSGRILNVCIDYDAKCEQHLNRAVKLDPSLVEAWNELGHCLWKKSDPKAAKNCFQTALAKKRNSESLRCLSVALRQEASTSTEQYMENMAKSLELSKEAVQLNPSDGSAWYSLGNAHFTQFFASRQTKAKEIESAAEAYKKALSFDSEKRNPDLHINYATALKYEQNYQECLEHVTKALRLDPTFSVGIDMKSNLESYLTRIYESVSRKGKLKAKRLGEMLKSLESSEGLGPFASGSMKLLDGSSLTVQPAFLSSLKTGPNRNLICCAKVVGVIPNEETIPYTFSVCDVNGSTAAVTVFNFSENFGVMIGDTIACPEPFVVDVALNFDDQRKVEFCCIRVPSPAVLVRNGKLLGKESVAFSDAKFTMITH